MTGRWKKQEIKDIWCEYEDHEATHSDLMRGVGKVEMVILQSELGEQHFLAC